MVCCSLSLLKAELSLLASFENKVMVDSKSSSLANPEATSPVLAINRAM
jgi:hypothetical protein